MNQLDLLIKNHKILICAGSGGVGKTTMSAAIAARGAELGLKVLVLTIDPAKRLATALGLEGLPSTEVRVPNQSFKGELWAAVVDSKKIFDDFVVSHISDLAERESVLKNRLYHQLSTTLSGSQEYTALEKLYQTSKNGNYDLIVLDTPPSQHAVDFLRAPQKMYSLFQNAVVKWFLPKSESKGFRGLFDRSTKMVFGTLETLTGSVFLEELREFFFVIKSLQETIQAHSAEIHRVLTGSTTTFIAVTSFDEVKIAEAKIFQKMLMSSGYSLSMVVINRSFPEWTQQGEDQLHDPSDMRIQRLKSYYDDLKAFYTKHQVAFEDFARGSKGEFDVVRIPDFDQDIHSLQSIVKIAGELVTRSGASS